MIVRDEVKAIPLVLPLNVLADGPEIIPQMQFARGLHAAENPGAIHSSIHPIQAGGTCGPFCRDAFGMGSGIHG